LIRPDIREKWVKAVVDWEFENGRRYPWRWIEDPYRILIAEVLLKRTTSTAASRAYTAFLERFPDVFSLYQAKVEDIEPLLRDIGLYRQRAHQIRAMAEYIVKEYSGELPPEYQKLIKVPGIGDYTASAVLVFAYGIPRPVVDSNVERVIARAFLTDKKGVKTIAEALLPRSAGNDTLRAYSYGLIDLGASTCHYKYPKCNSCPVSDLCRTFMSEREEPVGSVGSAPRG